MSISAPAKQSFPNAPDFVETGFIEPGWEHVRDGFLESQSGQPGGAQLAVYHDGRLVADIWTGEGWGGDSLGLLMSVSKAATAICIHRLAERGALSIDAPVSDYWPAFAANGKDEITVAHLLSHRAGMPCFPEGSGLDATTILDPACTSALIEKMTPLWEPGTAALYHAVTGGFALGEIVRRVTGRSIGHFLREDVAAPLALDLWIGTPDEVASRVRRAFVAVPWIGRDRWTALLESLRIDLADPVAQSLLLASDQIAMVIELLESPDNWHAEIPAAGGIGDARSLARLFAALIGPVDGNRILSEETVRRIAEPPEPAPMPSPLDRIPAESPARFGLGFEFPRDGLPMLGEGSFGHAGAGGRAAFAHPDSGIAVGYVCDALVWDGATPDPRWSGWTEALSGIVKGHP
jgi:CubicO group peptidase (beta-lactamase class C family)